MSRLIDLAIESHLLNFKHNGLNAAEDDPFFVMDLGEVTRQHRRWRLHMPGVHPFYAVKCNSDPPLLRLLAEKGTGFDCASVEEMRSVLGLGVDPARIIFANPCKSASSLVFARQAGVNLTTFDNLDELETIKSYHPDCRLVLRIFAYDKDALLNLSQKFGAPEESVLSLLQRARELDLNVMGVSFHVGTGACNAMPYLLAIQQAKGVFEQAQKLGHRMSLLDLGGGFQDYNFEQIARSLRGALGDGFPSDTRIIAEPGRYYARSAYTLACKVMSRRRQIGSLAKLKPDMLYQNDGVYGSFMNVLIEKETIQPFLVPGSRHGSKRQSGPHCYSIWGPTCDSVDCVVNQTIIESEVKVGDWLKYKNMGATQFNGFSKPRVVAYVDSESQDYQKEASCLGIPLPVEKGCVESITAWVAQESLKA
ncbi:hypothetical protein FE257_002659 [Aspergillus nanangensis]|uniref:ornithine decarboxylase n=1 Tax=Aspergillus nanangensis TaxID=2582783 RepID=A0AAD4GNZ7_ASPNN|nr:hypothetical protein FE257_002659 [Aspergillus nanangensis]